MKTLEYGCIGQLIIARSSALSKFSKETKDLEDIRKNLEESLISSAPENLREWLNDDLIISNLFEYGKSSRKLYFSDDHYGFTGENDIRKKLKELSKSWKNIVSIKIETSEAYRIEIKFNIVYIVY